MCPPTIPEKVWPWKRAVEIFIQIRLRQIGSITPSLRELLLFSCSFSWSHENIRKISSSGKFNINGQKITHFYIFGTLRNREFTFLLAFTQIFEDDFGQISINLFRWNFIRWHSSSNPHSLQDVPKGLSGESGHQAFPRLILHQFPYSYSDLLISYFAFPLQRSFGTPLFPSQ